MRKRVSTRSRFEVFKDRDYKAFKYFCGVCWNMVHDVEGTERKKNAPATT